ncbi:restriction endonuclease subunit S [Thermococcus sp.]|uniref:restriction endonuclease subunit S n=1 Tax=Thermococcus sp. TaxID=35749 RepID=UPI00262B0029|nr:restriction endonuclease subunit S [Thermococcus sp.]
MKAQAKTKFKKTPIGEIPEDWEVVKIKEVIKEAKPGFASGKRDENGIIQLRMNNITTEGKVTLKEYLKVPVPDNIDDYLLKPGDVLFNNTNSVDLIGKTAIFRGECRFCTYSNHITRIRVDSNQVLPEWVMYYFLELWRIGYFRQICVRYVGQASVKKTDLLNIKIPLPPLPEQKKIAEILRTVDEAIERTERLKKGLMQRLLTKGIKHERFKKTELGEIPEEWRVVRAGEICQSIVPGRNKPKKFDGDIPWITLADIDGMYVGASKSGLNVSKEEIKRCGNKIIPPNSVIMSCVGKFGIVAITTREVVLNQQLHAFVCPKTLDPYFLAVALMSQARYMESIATKTTVPYLNKDKINSIPIPIPPLSEQKQIAKILSTVDRKLELLRQRREKLERVKRGLMKDLLTGRGRVKYYNQKV